MSRRLPVYILIDTSGSMRGEPIEAVKVGLSDMIASLRVDPFALETVCISIITFDRSVQQVLPLTELARLQVPDIQCPESGPTFLGGALQLLCERYDKELRPGSPERKGDWMPLLFVLTDGKPSDVQEYARGVEAVKQRSFLNIVACAAGPKAQVEPLTRLTEHVYTLETMDPATFKRFFQWVTVNVRQGGRTLGITGNTSLPAPPQEVNIVL